MCLVFPATAADLHVGAGQTYATVQAAVDAAQAGDDVLVHAGSYTEDVDTAADGTNAARITLTSAGDGDVTITGRVTLDGDYWDITNLAFVGRAGSDAFRVRGDFNRIIGVELSGGDRDGIDGAGIGNEVRDSHIHDFDAGASDAHCIVLNPGAEDWIISGNELHDCSGDTLQLFASGAERTILNLLVENNHMYFTGALSRTENAIDVKNGDGLVFRGNLMHGFPDNKVVVFQKGPANIELSCNVMYDGFTGVEFRGEDGGTVENVTFTKNLMYDYSSYALKFDGTNNANVYNNTFVNIASDGLRIEGAGLNGGNVQNNLWSNTGTVESGSFVASHNGYFMAPTDIGSPNDVTGDPLLDGMYQLTMGSPMIDAGTDVGLTFDGVAPDIGHHETNLDDCMTAAGGGMGGGMGGAGGAANGGAGGGATASSSAGTGASGQGGGGANPAGDASDEEGGCACRTAGHQRDTPWWLLLALLVPLRRRCDEGRGPASATLA